MAVKVCYNKHMHKGKTKEGFTLVELSLSVVFIAVLSVAVAIIITNSISSYHRGVVLNQINTTGMEIVDDMRAAIQNASAHPVKNECGNIYEESASSTVLKACEDDNGKNFVVVTKRANVKLGKKQLNSVPVYGAFCTGSYSYIWNSGYFYSGGDATIEGVAEKAKLHYKLRTDAGIVEPTDIEGKLLKIHDEDRQVCIVAAGADYVTGAGNADNYFDITETELGGVLDETPYDLLGNNAGLTIYNLSTDTPAANAIIDSMFYTVSFILGTSTGGINVMSSGDFCTPPGDVDSGLENFNYCAINKFNFAAEANGG